MSRKYSFESESGEHEPLDNPNSRYPPITRGGQPHYQHQQQPQYHQQPPQQPQQEYYDPQPPQPQQMQRPRPGNRPGAHPDSSFNSFAANRRYSRSRSSSGGGQAPFAAAAVPLASPSQRQQNELVSPVSPPQPPAHRDADGRYWGQDIGYTRQPSHGHGHGHSPPQQHSNITPGADNFSAAAAGGIAGIAYTVAERNARESGMAAMAAPPPQPGYPQQAYHGQWQGQHQAQGQGYMPDGGPYDQPPQGMMHPAQHLPSLQGGHGHPDDRDSHSSLQPLGAAAVTPGHASPGVRTPSRSPHSFVNDVYTDDPYQGYSRGQDPNLGVVNPNDIEDDGDEGLVYGRSRGARTSMLSLGGQSSRSGNNHGAAAATAAGAGGVAAAAAVGRRAADGNGHYNAVHGANNPPNTGYTGGGGSNYDLGGGYGGEKSEWLSKQSGSRKKWTWCIGISVAVAVIAGVVCGVLFGVVFKNKGNSKASGGGSSSQTAAGDTAANGDLNINSPDIQGLLNNGNLHKVFPGIDYTPVNTQYPECLTFPPSQNNVTRDLAVLTQLSNTIRLYGTDCNQTQMAIHAIRQLGMQDTVKIWLGVWQDNNATTNARQLEQMWDILDEYGADPFKGLIVANEILFREQMTSWELGTLLASVRTNLTAKGISLPVATSDLGNKWDANLAAVSDYIMANIHPFFGGINAKQAASWTVGFWDDNLKSLFKSDPAKNVISETGWPSQGGTDCGGDGSVTNCPDMAVAGIDELNRFMADWVCPALSNGTQYFWFEAFDEPWKARFNSANQQWEDHWGLLDVNRNLKDGIQIPDCGGKTV